MEVTEARNKKFVLERKIQELLTTYMEETEVSEVQLELLRSATLDADRYIVQINVVI